MHGVPKNCCDNSFINNFEQVRPIREGESAPREKLDDPLKENGRASSNRCTSMFLNCSSLSHEYSNTSYNDRIRT